MQFEVAAGRKYMDDVMCKMLSIYSSPRHNAKPLLGAALLFCRVVVCPFYCSLGALVYFVSFLNVKYSCRVSVVS